MSSPDGARLAALPAAKPAVALAGTSYTYPRGQVALEDVDLDVPSGTRLGIFGPNGGGKSTLLRLVLGLLAPQEGRVEVFGRPPHDAVRDGLVGYVAQRQSAELRAPLSV
nr:ATP-binding cassette domain-containing protein [Acidobacteriota bacterium]